MATLSGQVVFAQVPLYADSAPNAFGSPNYAPWWAAAKPDVVNGTFTNMRNGTFPGTTTADPYDFIVYSTMDLGKRLHWIYWLPGETTSGLNNRFQVKFIVDWDGVDYAYDWNLGQLVVDAPEASWIQAGSWENYNDGTHQGVIGTFGMAWWVTDDDAPPGDTGGSPYDETDQADIDALRAVVLAHETHLI